MDGARCHPTRSPALHHPTYSSWATSHRSPPKRSPISPPTTEPMAANTTVPKPVSSLSPHDSTRSHRSRPATDPTTTPAAAQRRRALPQAPGPTSRCRLRSCARGMVSSLSPRETRISCSSTRANTPTTVISALPSRITCSRTLSPTRAIGTPRGVWQAIATGLQRRSAAARSEPAKYLAVDPEILK